MDNDTSGFLLLEFLKIWKLQTLYGILLLILYLMTVTENLLIVIAIFSDHHLHTPMFFFLMNLAMQDIGSITVIIPKAVFNSLMNIRFISYSGCNAQIFSSIFFFSYCISLLTIMAYDQYVAICNPLQYEMIMNRTTCIKMIGSVWVVSFLNTVLHTIATFTAPFCSNNINQFYCEIPHLLKIICSGLYVIETGIIAFTAILVMGCFFFIILTYVQFFSAVLRIPSVQGREKAFSTCLPHLIVITVFLFSDCFVYLRTISDNPSHLDFIITKMCSVIPSILNPLIYGMRNKQIKIVLIKLLNFK